MESFDITASTQLSMAVFNPNFSCLFVIMYQKYVPTLKGKE